MVIGGHKQILDKIFIECLHALNPFAAAVLALDIVDRHSLDIAEPRHGNHNIVVRDQILHIDVKFVVADGCPPVISVFVAYHKNFITDNSEQHLLIGENFFEACDLLLQIRVFRLQPFTLQAGQRTQSHIHNRLCLHIVQPESFRQPFLCNRCCF